MSKSILIAVFALVMLVGAFTYSPIDTTESMMDNCGRTWSQCH